MKSLALFLLFCLTALPNAFADNNFNGDWQFRKKGQQWQAVQLPHTAHIEPYISNDMWMGVCEYKKNFPYQKQWENKKVFLNFEGAMGIAKIKLNGQLLRTHFGGYIGFQVDLSDHLKQGNNILEVELDNRENFSYPPGKEYRRLDFSWFSGLYRNVSLEVKDKLYISDAVAANIQGGGGIFVTYPKVSKSSATIKIKTHVINEYQAKQNLRLEQSLWYKGKKALCSNFKLASLDKGQNQHIDISLNLSKPKLWSPAKPRLYTLKTQLFNGKAKLLSTTKQKIGIRSISYSDKGFFINGKKMYQRGTNRHQEFPYIGYAASDEAQYRDAVKIKAAGFDIVRLSHYPQSPAFMRACDELGLMVIDCITGWQAYHNGEFAKRSLQEAREMIRRDRNHPSVVLWETSLNESGMPNDFLQKMHNIVDQEYPGNQSFSGSFRSGPHDVFLPARQHGKGPHYWDKWSRDNKAAFTAEYGDWEYYAQAAANFNQDGAKDLNKVEKTSRQLRKHGEKRLLQMALNYQESHNQNLRGKSIVGDANWLMFDYNRGYANDHCTSGIMDLMRLPKFAYYFYQSQRPAHEKSKKYDSGPMLFAATYWQENSNPKVRVFSNCDTVIAYLNGKEISRQKPDQDKFSDNINHPPFTFDFGKFTPGTISFKGLIKGKKVVSHSVSTPGEAMSLKIFVDQSGKKLKADNNDFVFVYAAVVDAKGSIVPEASNQLNFTLQGGSIVGPSSIKAEAGINGVLVRANAKTVNITVESKGLKKAQFKLKTK